MESPLFVLTAVFRVLKLMGSSYLPTQFVRITSPAILVNGLARAIQQRAANDQPPLFGTWCVAVGGFKYLLHANNQPT